MKSALRDPFLLTYNSNKNNNDYDDDDDDNDFLQNKKFWVKGTSIVSTHCLIAFSLNNLDC